MTRYDPAKHHRRSIRLKGYDYTQAGAYFVTIVTRERELLFGEVINGEMRLNAHGRVVESEWLRTAEVRPNVELDAFVVMPNHLHGILIIRNDAQSRVGASRHVGASQRLAPTGPVAGSLGAIMAQFKSICTKRINRTRHTPGAPVWQRNYYERIVRNERELNAIRQYIRHNPARWADDMENPNGGNTAG